MCLHDTPLCIPLATVPLCRTLKDALYELHSEALDFPASTLGGRKSAARLLGQLWLRVHLQN